VQRDFYSHVPCGARLRLCSVLPNREISTHTPLAGRDQEAHRAREILNNFYSHAPCGARQCSTQHSSGNRCISPHTPLAGRDNTLADFIIRKINFYSHAPCGARRQEDSAFSTALIFLLTRPLRGATPRYISRYFLSLFLLTRPLRGATRMRRP